MCSSRTGRVTRPCPDGVRARARASIQLAETVSLSLSLSAHPDLSE